MHAHAFVLSAMVAGLGLGPDTPAAHAQGCDWSPLASGTGFASDCVVTSNGDAIFGTRIDYAGGQEVGFLARWDGSTWSSVGGGVNDLIRVVELDTNGDVLVGGWFAHTMSGLLVNGLARWDGASWHAYGPEFTPGVRFGYPEAILPLGGGQLVVAGGFLQAGGTLAAGRVALWDGANWQYMGGLYTPNRSATVQALAQLEDGTIVAGGDFRLADAGTSVNGIARWDGVAWQPMGNGIADGSIQALLALPSGDLLAAGGFSQIDGVPANNIARWDGVAWYPLGVGVADGVYTLAHAPAGDVLVGGVFRSAGGLPASCIAMWSPTTGQWSSLGSGVPISSVAASVLGVAASPTTYYIAGQFQDNLTATRPVNVAQFRLDAEPPVVDPQPSSPTTCIGGSVTLSASGVGARPFSFQWQREASPGLWVDLEDRVIPVWGTIVGARTDTLTITRVASGLPRTMRVLVSNSCRSVPSQPVTISVGPICCLADMDDGTGSGTPDGGVTIDDLLFYLATFADGISRADVDDGTGTGTPDGGVTIDDLLYFLARYEEGC